MEKELFELCNQVYEATKFETGEWFEITENLIVTDEDKYIMEQDTVDTPYDFIPRYTSDYLLEKLPQFIRFDGFEMSRLEVCPAGYGKEYKTPNYTPKRPYVAEWCAGYSTKHGEIIKLGVSDTPRKALLKLVIALDDAGVKL